MELDLERVMILLHRRYNFIREISRLTNDLSQAFSRNDQVSSSMLLEMRAEEMGKVEACTEEIWKLGSIGAAEESRLRELMTSEPMEVSGTSEPEEKKIYEIRRKTSMLIEEIRAVDRRMNQRVIGEKSFYAQKP